MQEVDNVLRIFEEAKVALQKEDVAELKRLSDQTTNTASLTQDPDNITVAVIIYSLSKVLERENYKKLPGWKKFYSTCNGCIDATINAIKSKNLKKISLELNHLREAVGNISGNLKKHIQDVFRKASINKASKIYDHGISMEKTAKLLGVTMFELANYSGQKESIDEIPHPQYTKPVNVKSRIKLAEEIFQ